MSDRSTKRIGQFVERDDYSDYWATSVSDVAPHHLSIRGYPIEEVVAELSYTETLFLTVRGRLPSPVERRVFDAALSCLPDHAFFSSQAGAARFVASGWPQTPVPAIAAGLLCIGQVTISPQGAGELIVEGLGRVRDEGLSLEEAAGQAVEAYLAAGKVLPGFGHPHHKEDDIRASALRAVAVDAGQAGEGGAFYDEVHRCLVERKGRFLPMNVDGTLAWVLHDLGFHPLEMAGVVAVAILPGVIAHAVEEIREGVPLRMIPTGSYVGEPVRHVPSGSGLYAGPPPASPINH